MELADHIGIENGADFLRGRHTVTRLDERVLVLLADDVHAELDALIADEYRRTGDQLPDLVLAFSAERAVKSVLFLSHSVLSPAAGTNVRMIRIERPDRAYGSIYGQARREVQNRHIPISTR
jgi:hypothetical protein